MAYSATNVGSAGLLSTTTGVVVKFFEWFGNLAMFCGRLVRSAVTPPYELREFVHQFDELGSKSLPLVALAGAATGIVLMLSTRDSLIRFGAKSFLPAVVIFSLIKESGPIITALVVSGRAAAEPISLQLFIHAGFKNVTFKDFLPPTLKTIVFGLLIGVISCFQGMHTRGGTEGVERAATNSVVLASLFIILADVLLVRLILVFFS
jgi:ABC-type transporter Mla maintaining outer membrane lipid asymmetry permease subunit MlaE